MLSALLLVSQVACNDANQKINVLFIAADDLNCDISAYGVSQVKTPNLDRLAKMGVQFNNAYCQQPLCGPSRASIMSGMRPNTSGNCTNYDELRGRIPDMVTLGQFFINKGYYSGRVGKLYHYNNPSEIGTNGHGDDAQTWLERFNPMGIDKTHRDSIICYGKAKINGKNSKLGISMSWWNPESKDEEHTDGMVANKAIQMIEEHKDDPFFIGVGFFNPHCPYVAPKKYFDLYDLNEIKMQDITEAKEDLKDVPDMAIRRDTKAWPYYFKGITTEQAKQCKLAYYASVSFVDAQIGRLLDALEDNNLMDNTIIVFFSDHGYFLGEKGLWYKRKAFERSARVPLMVKVPKGVAGRTCNNIVELLDLYPTIVDYAGFPVPEALDGSSMRPLLTEKVGKWKDFAITQVHHEADAQGYSIRNRRWRYTEWNKGEAGRELYDHENDTEEITNLANDAKYNILMDSLSREIRAYSDTYKPNTKTHK